ncbi:MAG: hypothetical protein L0271_02765 [Gemmatimonadetes bacterium]|nr:hypothetical protein [Gemmatimonadota bacterium]
MTTHDPHGRDPLRRDAELSHRLTLPVLGIPVSFESNSEMVIEIADEAYGAWRSLDRLPAMISAERVRIRIFVEDAGSTVRPGAMVYRLASADRVLLWTGGTAGITDVTRRDGVAWVQPSLLHERAMFRYSVLEAMTQSVLTFLDRLPLHAAAIERNGVALLLAGPSGTGKSTLACTAALNGWSVLADDVVFLQTVPELRIWGLPGHLHLPPSATETFPQLGGAPLRLLANGKTKIAVDVRSIDALPATPFVTRAGICLLDASPDPSVTPLSADEVESALLAELEPGFDRFADSLAGAVRELARDGGWRLGRGGDPAAALALIDRLLDEVARRN